MSDVDVVKHVYDRFMHGDVPAILAAFDDRIEFRLAEGHPYSPDRTPWIGHEAIVQHFFMKAGAEWENWAISILDIVQAPGAVVVEGRYTGIYKPTGRNMDVQVCHVWKFRNGKAVSFHQYLDTAQLRHVMAQAV